MEDWSVAPHDGGAFSEVSISGIVPVEPMVAGVELFTSTGTAFFDANESNSPENLTTIATEFAHTVRTGSHPLDAQRGLYVQRLLDSTARLLSGHQRGPAPGA